MNFDMFILLPQLSAVFNWAIQHQDSQRVVIFELVVTPVCRPFVAGMCDGCVRS
jgi:hypothetical protein